jgi:RNA 3'-terminal phosphate cyclase (ATP)
MIDIDGGVGGGQILRSSLALAAITGEPVRVRDIRGNRPEPGLKPQHLAVVETLAGITDATVTGGESGSTEIEFEPGPPTGGRVTARIETAGSISLLFDAVLPLAAAIDDPLAVTATGGTEVEWSPPLVTHQRTKLPLCRRFGVQAAIERERTGFYPAGGGRATLHLAPSSFSPLSLADRGSLATARVSSLASTELADSEVARRQARAARDGLADHDIPVEATHKTTVETRSIGSAVAIHLVYEGGRAGFDALGERGVPAEDVAASAVDEAVAFHERASAPAVDRHLADQLLVFLALAGGELRVPELTDHVSSSLAVLEAFGYDLRVDRSGPAPLVRRE